jgi:cephalosporin-C deacetylase-like acetyl esterase
MNEDVHVVTGSWSWVRTQPPPFITGQVQHARLTYDGQKETDIGAHIIKPSHKPLVCCFGLRTIAPGLGQ